MVYDRLTGNGDVMALVNGVYDRAPQNPWGLTEAYISFGAEDTVADDAECIDGEELTIQLDIWSRKPGRVECKKIMHAVKSALHERDDLELSTNALSQCRLVLTRLFLDRDGLTTHGVMQFTFHVEAT